MRCKLIMYEFHLPVGAVACATDMNFTNSDAVKVSLCSV